MIVFLLDSTCVCLSFCQRGSRAEAAEGRRRERGQTRIGENEKGVRRHGRHLLHRGGHGHDDHNQRHRRLHGSPYLYGVHTPDKLRPRIPRPDEERTEGVITTVKRPQRRAWRRSNTQSQGVTRGRPITRRRSNDRRHRDDGNDIRGHRSIPRSHIHRSVHSARARSEEATGGH